MSDSHADLPGISELVELHYGSLYRYAMRLSGSASDAEDLTQQAFLVAHRKLEQVRSQEHVRAWLFSILRNNYLKQQRRQQILRQIPWEKVPDPATDPEEGVVEGEELQLVLDELPEEFRSPLILFYFREFSYREIAEHLQVPMGTVMSRLSRGREYLRQRLVALQDARSHTTDNPQRPS